jgi:hypothetical protein
MSTKDLIACLLSLLFVVAAGSFGADEDVVRPPASALKVEPLPLECPDVAHLAQEDLKLRVALFKALLGARSERRLCVGVFSRGRLMAPPPALLETIGLPGEVTGPCGCRWWEPGVRVVLLPEVRRRKDNSLALGSPRGSASDACNFKARPEGTEWLVDGQCTFD